MNPVQPQTSFRPSLQHSLLVLGKLLGSGGYGSVYKAHWGNQPCAVKTFFLSQSELAKQSIQTEISFLQTLRHRHIIQFYRTHQDHGHTYLLMELAENGSLQHAILNTHPSLDDWTTKRRLASEIAQGLAFIHQEGIIHRDLKSANVLLTRHMEVKLADFGLAQIKSMTLRSLKTSNQSRANLLGTLRWIAPELLFAKKPKYTAKSDVYALGVVMWEMAANCARPFNDQDNDACVALAVSNGERETFPDDTPAEYRSWAERCWRQDPIQRPDASEVVQIHDEPAKESTENDDDIFLDDSFGQSGLTGGRLGTHGGHQGASGAKATHHENADQHIGQLPSTDDDVVSHMCTAAKQGSVEAQMFLGWMYDYGHGVGKSEKDAFWWYRLAASHGTVVAQLRVAKMYEQARGVQWSREKATSWYLRAAEGGSAEAQYQIADMYASYFSDKHDDEKASRWYHMAADQGHSGAQYQLWQLYSLGRHVKQSDEEALKWLTLAAQQGNTDAQYELGMAYWNGQGATKSDAEAVKWLILAAQHGNISSQFKLYSMYDEGQRVEQSTTEAVKWLTKMAEQGHLDSQFDLGFRYREGRGVEQNDDEAVKWFAMAADREVVRRCLGFGPSRKSFQWFTKLAKQGVRVAQFYLGVMHETGDGAEKSEIEAFKWYSKAAEQGYDRAQRTLGRLYMESQGIEKNCIEASKWFTKAAEQGDAAAQNSLGRLYDFGIGVEQSDRLALQWYGRSAAQQDPLTLFSLGSMYELGLEVEPDANEALRLFRMAGAEWNLDGDYDSHIEWLTSAVYLGRHASNDLSDVVSLYQQGAEQDYEAAMYSLGRMYEKGLGVTKSVEEAIVWYRKAVKWGHLEADARLKSLLTNME